MKSSKYYFKIYRTGLSLLMPFNPDVVIPMCGAQNKGGKYDYASTSTSHKIKVLFVFVSTPVKKTCIYDVKDITPNSFNTFNFNH